MIKIGDITIDTKENLTPDEAQKVKAILVAERVRKKQRSEFYKNKYQDLEFSNEEDLSILFGDLGINSYEDLDDYYENLNKINSESQEIAEDVGINSYKDLDDYYENQDMINSENREIAYKNRGIDVSKMHFYLKRDLPPERLKQARHIIGIEDDIINDQKESAKPKKAFINPTKIVVTFFAFAYLVIIFFAPVNIPKLGTRFVPFYTIGEHIEKYYSEGVGYIPSYVRELNVQVLILELFIATIVFVWSLYFFKRNKGDKRNGAWSTANKWGEAWDNWGKSVVHAVVVLLVILALIWFYPPSDNPIDYAELLKPVDSSAIRSVGHSFFDRVLVVEFENGEYLYTYYDVPRSEYKNILKADSIGRYVNENIKGSYEVKRELWN